MSSSSKTKNGRLFVIVSLLFAIVLLTAGCTVHTSGMTLPNPDYLNNRVQYLSPGTEFPFPNEANQIIDSNSN
ncbi:MAG: hypothetical protein LBU65_13315 [Planctomycetaceae bacterium]|nr:hypothetical protein [Planctomycetaceae bacterium]